MMFQSLEEPMITPTTGAFGDEFGIEAVITIQ